MPFTISHIGYILPIHQKWEKKLSVSGLIFGSIAPDYDILFRLTKVRFHIFQYDAKSILFYIFPLSLISAFFFHLVCRNIIIKNLPGYYERKYQKYTSYDFFHELRTHYFRVSISILFAILLHLFLDYLCHIINAYYLKMYLLQLFHIDIIANLFYLLGIYGLPVLFSLVGFYLIYTFEYNKSLSLKNLKLTKTKSFFWFILLLNTFLFFLIKLHYTEKDNEFYVDFIIISLTSSFLVALYFTCFLFLLFQKLTKK